MTLLSATTRRVPGLIARSQSLFREDRVEDRRLQVQQRREALPVHAGGVEPADLLDDRSREVGFLARPPGQARRRIEPGHAPLQSPSSGGEGAFLRNLPVIAETWCFRRAAR
jgi:hypothetical protein